MSEEPEPKYRKTILCLANSRKPGGRCVAGKEYFDDGEIGAWVRPTNAKHGDAISEYDLQYTNGKSADLLDIVSVPMSKAAPDGHQKENEQIDPNYYWINRGRATWQQIVSATDAVKGSLWANDDSSYHGLNDKVADGTIKGLGGSLLLIQPTDLALVVGSESKYGGGSVRRVRARFKLNGLTYNFVVTDPWAETRYFVEKDGAFAISEARLCVSLPEIKGGYSTKLVAAVITPERIGNS